MMTRSLLVVAALLVVPACGDDDDDLVVGDPVDDTVAAGQANGALIADTAADELTGEDFFVVIGKTAGMLAAINDGVINHAGLGVQLVAFDDIFDFANQLIIEHEDSNIALDAVVRFYGVGYIPSAAEGQLIADAQAMIADLRSTSPSDVDFVFTEQEVLLHAQAQVVLDELAFQVGDNEMGDFIEDMRGMIDDHLGDAEDLLATFY